MYLEANREHTLKSIQRRLSNTILQLTHNETPFITPIPGLIMYQYTAPSQLVTTLYEPSICISVQGEKRVFLKDESFTYDPNTFLLSSINLPATIQITKASQEQPFAGFLLKLDYKEISQLLLDSNIATPYAPVIKRGMTEGPLTNELLQPFERLINLIQSQKDIPVLAPLIRKEIIYRLLTSQQGLILRQALANNNRHHAIANLIQWMKDHYDKPLTISDLTGHSCMSASSLHSQFRALTSMSPMQYLKELRLHEARRLMLTESESASQAAFSVGYDSPSQFNREYKRLFGNAPKRDINQLKHVLPSK